VDDDDPRVFAALLAAVYNAALARGCSYFMLGLSEANPLRPVLTRAYRHVAYPSRLYLVAWEDGLEAIEQVDGRVPAPEVASYDDCAGRPVDRLGADAGHLGGDRSVPIRAL
jgi:hypothetical protein